MQSPLVTLWLLSIQVCFGSQNSENVCGLDDCTVLLQSNHAAIDQAISFMGEQDMALADSMQEFTKRLTPGYTKDLFQSFSICGDCKTWQRFGELHDGGYLSCMDNMKSGTLLAAYSMGVEHHDKWSKDIYKSFHIPVYQYDCTLSTPPQDCGDCHFFPACLSSGKSKILFPGKTSWTLEEAIENSKMLSWKCQIEVCWWRWTLKRVNGQCWPAQVSKRWRSFDNWSSNFISSTWKTDMQSTFLRCIVCGLPVFEWFTYMVTTVVAHMTRKVLRFQTSSSWPWIHRPVSWPLVRTPKMLSFWTSQTGPRSGSFVIGPLNGTQKDETPVWTL